MSPRFPALVAMAVMLSLFLSTPVLAGVPQSDLDLFRAVPTLDSGRIKPMDSYARATIRFLTGVEHYQGKDPMETLLDLAHNPGDWSRRPFISIGFVPLKERIGLDKKAKFISPHDLMSNQKFAELIEEIRQSGADPNKMTPLEKEAATLFHKMSLINEQAGGYSWKLIPHPSDPDAAWIPLIKSDSLELKTCLTAMNKAYPTGNQEAYSKNLKKLIQLLPKQSKLPYPDRANLDREVSYNQLKPYEKSAFVYLIGFFAFLAALLLSSERAFKVAMAVSAGGLFLHAYGMILRSVISGRPPVSNVYETMIWVPWGMVLFAFILELVKRGKYIGMISTLLASVILFMSDQVPLDPAISPLVPVLRSSYWLIVHVLTITLGYSAATLAMGLGHLWLILYLLRRPAATTLRNVEHYLIHAVQLSVLFIGVGTVLGGVWANQSWGRYWAWDPKETWALISLLGYLAIVHARTISAIRGFGTAVASILSWQLVLFTWYGVNYFLVGLHSYAGGNTSAYLPWQILLWAVIEGVFLAVCFTAYKKRKIEAPKVPVETSDSQ